MHVNHNTHFRQFNILLSRHRNIPSTGLSAAPKEHGIPGSEIFLHCLGPNHNPPASPLTKAHTATHAILRISCRVCLLSLPVTDRTLRNSCPICKLFLADPSLLHEQINLLADDQFTFPPEFLPLHTYLRSPRSALRPTPAFLDSGLALRCIYRSHDPLPPGTPVNDSTGREKIPDDSIINSGTY